MFQRASRDLDSLKTGMDDLQTMQAEIAEFFCEDAAAFKLDECFKSIGTFCSKFKKVGNLTF